MTHHPLSEPGPWGGAGEGFPSPGLGIGGSFMLVCALHAKGLKASADFAFLGILDFHPSLSPLLLGSLLLFVLDGHIGGARMCAEMFAQTLCQNVAPERRAETSCQHVCRNLCRNTRQNVCRNVVPKRVPNCVPNCAPNCVPKFFWRLFVAHFG